MRVISQDKDYSVDFDRTPFWLEGQYIYATVGNKSIMLAAYKSKDRAKGVFQDMHDEYAPEPFQMPYFGAGSSIEDDVKLLNDMTRAEPAVLTIPHDEGCECIFNPNTIYYMPEE